MIVEARLKQTEAGLVPASTRYNASSPEDTQDVELAYARFPPARPPGRYYDGLLPN